MSRLTTLSLLAIAALAAGPTRGWGVQDPKKPAPGPAPTPGPDVTSPIPSIGRVTPPAPLSRADLARRLKTIDGSLPDVLPAGATVTLTPDRLQTGRTWLWFEHVELLYARPGQAVAAFSGCWRLLPVFPPRSVGGTLWLSFDGVAGAQYALDAFVTVEEDCSDPAAPPPPPPPPMFEASVYGPSGVVSQHSSTSDNGHVVVGFTTAANARYSVQISLPRRGWRFYRVDLARLP